MLCDKRTMKDKLFKRLPKKYHCLINDIQSESDLIDDCKYMIYFNQSVKFCGDSGYYSLPVKNLKEAVEFIKCCDVDNA